MSSGVGVLGLLWAAAGIVLGLRWWRERQVDGPAATEAGDRTTERVHFGSLREDRGPRRLQAMRRSYALGAWLVALGLVADQVLPLAAGALALNLGTLFHHLALALDGRGLEVPAVELPRSRPLALREQALA